MSTATISPGATGSLALKFTTRFRGQRLLPSMLRRRGLPLAVADLDLDENAEIVDLDDPAILRRERLRPSQVATRDRTVTPLNIGESVSLSDFTIDEAESLASGSDLPTGTSRQLLRWILKWTGGHPPHI